MNLFLILAFIFLVGSTSGWVLELFFRRFYSSANTTRRWINPGFLVGPYLPLYGFSLCAVYLLAQIDVSFIENPILRIIVLVIIMGILVTGIEYLAGIIFIKGMKVKLWDYSNEWGNIQGIICPKFTLAWIFLSAVYYFFIHPNIQKGILWLSENLSFSFVMGFFYGVFCIDLCYSMSIMNRIHKFAEDNQIIVRYERLRESISRKNDEHKEKRHFILSMYSDTYSFSEQLKSYLERERNEYGDKLKNLQEKAVETIQEATENLQEKVENLQEKAPETLQEISENLQEKTEQLIQKTSEMKEKFSKKK